MSKTINLPKGFGDGKEIKSVVYRFKDTWDLVIVPNKDMSVSFVFWADLDKGMNNRFFDWAIPVYKEKFG